MFLSFIIPYYNEPIELLSECLSSVVECANELGDEMEMIVVDDGSEVDIENDLIMIDRRIKYIRQDNHGLSAARNAGMSMAQGEYLQFIDSDDALMPIYKELISTLKTEKPDVLMFDFLRRKQTTDYRNLTRKDVLADCSGNEFLQKHNLRAAACMYMFRKIVCGDLRFHVGIYHEDELFTPQLLLRAQRVIVTDAKAYYYRIRNSSITTAVQTEKVEKRLDDTVFVLDKLRNVNMKHLNRRISQLTMDYVYNLHTLKGRDESMRGLRMKELYKKKLMPLPLKTYTWKYFIFSLLSRLL